MNFRENKLASRIEIKREDDKRLYVVLSFKEENNDWYQIKLAVPKDRLEKI